MMVKAWPIMIILLLAVSACESVPAAYRVEPVPIVSPSALAVRVATLEDARPEEEKTGAGAGLMNRSTKDDMYTGPVDAAITETLIDELRGQGLNATTTGSALYTISGEITSYSALIIPPRTAFIPYVRFVTWTWSDDEISVGVAVTLRVERSDGTMIYQKDHDLARDERLWVGIVGLASSMRRINRPELVKFLRVGLDNILTEASADIAAAIRADRARILYN